MKCSGRMAAPMTCQKSDRIRTMFCGLPLTPTFFCWRMSLCAHFARFVLSFSLGKKRGFEDFLGLRLVISASASVGGGDHLGPPFLRGTCRLVEEEPLCPLGGIHPWV